MNKSQLISAMSEKSGLTKTQSKAALDSFIDSVQTAVAGNDPVVLTGFGTFSKGSRSAGTSFGKPRPATNTFKFKPGSVSKACVN